MGADIEIDELVLFDGLCSFCNQAVLFILAHEREARLKFASLQSETGQTILKMHHLPSDYTDSVLYVSADELLSHSRAAFRVAQYLKAPWSWLSLFQTLPTFLTDYGYKVIAKHRYKIVKPSDSCVMPSPVTKKRFLE